MTLVAFNRMAFAVALVAAVVLAFVVPAIRARLRRGRWPFASPRGQRPVERLVGWALFLCGAGFAAWSIAYATLGPQRLGVWDTPGWLAGVGWVVSAMGLLVIIVAQVQMGRAWVVGIGDSGGGLVTGGLFRVMRHPIYSGVIVAFGGVVLVSPAAYTLTLLVATLVVFSVQARLEERYLRRKHGETFDAWAASVGRFVPGVGRLR